MPISRAALRSSGTFGTGIRAAAILVATVTSLAVLPAMSPTGTEVGVAAAVYLAGSGSGSSADGSGDGGDGGSGAKSSGGKADKEGGSDQGSSGDGSSDKAGDGGSGGGKSGDEASGSGQSGDGESDSGTSGSGTSDPGTSGSGTSGAGDGTTTEGAGSQAPDPSQSATPSTSAVPSTPPSAPPTPTDVPAAPVETRWKIEVEPGDQTVSAGEKVLFTARYSAEPASDAPVTIRWQTAHGKDGPWSDVDGATGEEMQVTAGPDVDGALFRAEVTGEKGSGAGTSAPVTLHVDAAGALYGTVADPTIDLGQEQTAVGHNFVPGSKVKISIEPDGMDLGTVEAAPDGTVTKRFDTSRLLAGQHTVTWTPVVP